MATEAQAELDAVTKIKREEFVASQPFKTVIEASQDSIRVVRGTFVVPDSTVADTGWKTSFQRVDSVIPVNFVTILAPGVMRRLNASMFVGYGTEMFWDGINSPPPNCDWVFNNWSGYPAAANAEGITIELPLMRHVFTVAFGSGGSLTVGAVLPYTFIFQRR
ncbi:MAG: hypothetical protein QXZ36_03710 [Thermoproteota archaeon]